MKMRPEHFNRLKSAVDMTLDHCGRKAVIDEYENGQFPRADRVKNLQTRFNFDLFYEAVRRYDPELPRELYDYLNDNHIATGLMVACPKIVQRYFKE